jgi:hypothetical protein
MNTIKRILCAFALSSLAAASVRAACDGVTTSCNPAISVAPTATITTIVASALNSGSTANVTNSVYFFEATTGGTPTDVPDNVNGTIQFIGQNYLLSPANASDSISILIDPVVGGTLYNLFVQACPPNTAQPDTSGCSAWVSLGSVTTTIYPPNPGFQNVTPPFTTPSSFTALTANVQNSNDVSAWQLFVSTADADLPAGADSSIFTQQPYAGASNGGSASFSVTNAMYSHLLPNLGYTSTERLEYHYNKFGPFFKIGKFFTQPVNPVPGAITGVTHCSATLAFQNAAANPANPKDSPYTVNIGGQVASGSQTQTVLIGGVGSSGADVFNDTNSVTFTNLQAGQSYSPTVQVGNRGGGSWLTSSAPYPGSPALQTIAWGGSFNVANIGTTSTDFVASGVNTAGVQTWQIQTTPAVAGLPSGTASDLNGTHTMTGLVPNTQYTVQVKITESGGCFSILPLAPISFTTTPTTPSAFNLVPGAAGVLAASWTVGAGDPAGTTYQVQYCLDAGFSSGCATKNVTNNGASTNLTGLAEETTYFAHVKALTVGGGLDSAYSNSASAETINIAPVVPAPICTQGAGNTATCSVSNVVDNDLGNGVGVLYQWTVAPSAGTTLVPASTSGSSSSSNSTTLTYPSSQSYTVTVTVTDHNGGPGGLATSNHTTFNPGQVPTTISIAPTSATVGTGQASPSFTATVYDQNSAVITNQSVNWAVSGGGSLSAPTGVSTIFNAANTPGGPFMLTASVASATPSTATITVVRNTVTVTGPTTGITGSPAQFTATVKNPSGATITPTINWSATGGSIDTSGLYTPSQVGSFTITATDQYGDVGTAPITNSAAGPQVNSFGFVMSAGNKGGVLTIVGHDNVAHVVNSAFSSDPSVTFNPASLSNIADNVAGTSAVTFSTAGIFTLTDNLGSGVSTTTVVAVPRVLSGIKVCAMGDAKCVNQITIQTLQTQQFTATPVDQFGNAMSASSISSIVWSNNVNASGALASFSSSSLGENIHITATGTDQFGNQATGFVNVNLVSFDVSGAHAFPVPYKASQGSGVIHFTGLGSQSTLHIYTTSGRRVFDISLTSNTYDWPIVNSSGESIASGVYFYVVQSSQGKKDGKLIIIK